MDKKTPGGDDVMRYSSGGNNYPSKTMITLHLTEIKNHAEVGAKIVKVDEKHNHPESLSSVRLIMLMSQSH
jgi:hypothetical protein